MPAITSSTGDDLCIVEKPPVVPAEKKQPGDQLLAILPVIHPAVEMGVRIFNRLVPAPTDHPVAKQAEILRPHPPPHGHPADLVDGPLNLRKVFRIAGQDRETHEGNPHRMDWILPHHDWMLGGAVQLGGGPSGVAFLRHPGQRVIDADERFSFEKFAAHVHPRHWPAVRVLPESRGLHRRTGRRGFFDRHPPIMNPDRHRLPAVVDRQDQIAGSDGGNGLPCQADVPEQTAFRGIHAHL
ncbi:MAG: hypothetical protein HY736_27215 [Verrucomicrobia bacterium]|nr:hypothetical protein [Verrucomicrobiota bacterium]